MKMRKLARWRQLVILVLLEAGFYLIVKPKDLAMFFFFWTVIGFASLIYNVLRIQTDGTIMSIGSNSSDAYSGLASALMEEQYKTKHTRKVSGGGIKDFVNWIYLIFLVINGILYWVFQ